MSSVESGICFNVGGMNTFVDSRVEPLWLAQHRRNAIMQFDSMDWPDRRSEEWMRSDLRLFHPERYPLPGESGESASATSLRLLEGLDPAGQMQIFDGCVGYEQLDESVRSRGVFFGSLEKYAIEQEELVRKHLFQVISPLQDKFAALHAATWSGGQLLYVPRNVSVTKPFYVSTGMRDHGSDTGHTLIILEDGAEATFVCESSSPTSMSHGFHSGGVEIIVGKGAHLRYVNLQDWGRNVWHFAHQRATVDRDGSLQWTIAGMGAKFAQVSQQVALIGEGASSQVNGVMFTQERQQMTYNTLQHHCKPIVEATSFTSRLFKIVPERFGEA